MMGRGGASGIRRRSEREIGLMREAGSIVAEVFRSVAAAIRPGISTWDLNAVVEDVIVANGGEPLFKGYRGFPAASCISINEEVVHGIPSKKKILSEGDIVSVDVGVRRRGYCGDAAVTFPVGEVSAEAKRLMEATAGALGKGIEAARDGARLSDIGAAVQKYAESFGFGVVRRFVGHGIGTEMHEAPQIPNYVDEEVLANDVLLRNGMVLAIEPMVTEGTYEVVDRRDGWTVVTADGGLAAHFEHTIALTATGPEILTPWHEKIDSEFFSGIIGLFTDCEHARSHAERRAD